MGRRDIVKQYITKLEQIYEDNNFLRRVQDLATLIRAADNQETIITLFTRFDTLDMERVRYMTVAENFAGRPQPTGIYEWSPGLEHSGQLVTYWKLRMNLRRQPNHPPQRLLHLQSTLNPNNTGGNHTRYIRGSLSEAWKTLCKAQKGAKQRRGTHMEVLVDHYAKQRYSTREQEIKKITQSERTWKASAKHKWYLRERHGMIRSLLVPDYIMNETLSVLGMLALTTLKCAACYDIIKLTDELLVASIVWGVATSWRSLIKFDGWKVLTNPEVITHCLIQRNGNHLSMSGDSPFARGELADAIGKDDKGKAVDEILKGTFKRDTQGTDGATASSEIQSFIKALKIPISNKKGDTIPLINTDISLQNYIETYSKTRE